MQFESPTNSQPQLTRKVTPSPRKLQIENVDPLDATFGGKLPYHVRIVKNCKTVRELGSVLKMNGKIFKRADSLRAVLKKVDEFKMNLTSRDVAILLNVVSKSKFAVYLIELYRAILASLSDAALSTLQEASAKDVSMTLHALVKRGIRNTELFHKAPERGIDIIADFNPEGLSNMLMALAKMNSYSFEFFDRASKAAISMMFDEDFNSQSVCFVADAFARTNHYDPELFFGHVQKGNSILGYLSAPGFVPTH
mmetsp:Transcript_11410/g.27561  ORF Transcript_11410/g.27561 Transcript_11410/m.27561 type:complete len:253 (+) Transcript_11410:2542-3300(+)